MQLSPHLCFAGNCAEAFTFYAEIFAGDLTLVRFDETPAADRVPKEWSRKVVHCTLVSGAMRLSGADVLPSQYELPQGIYMLIEPESEAEAATLFTSLSAEGEVIMPLEATFWSPAFGMCKDRFGITWELSCAGQGEVA